MKIKQYLKNLRIKQPYKNNWGKIKASITTVWPHVKQFVKSKNLILFLLILVFGGAMFWSGVQYERDKSVSAKNPIQDSISGKNSPPSAAPSAKRSPIFEGVVEKIDDKSITVKRNDGTISEFSFDPKMQVTDNGKIGGLDTINKDDNVIVYSRLSSDNQQIAYRIVVETILK